MKGKGERERYTQLNVEFQRIARRNKKAFLSEKCEEREENNRMGKMSDLFRSTYQVNTSCKDGHDEGHSKKQQKRLRRGGKNAQKNYTKRVLMI